MRNCTKTYNSTTWESKPSLPDMLNYGCINQGDVTVRVEKAFMLFKKALDMMGISESDHVNREVAFSPPEYVALFDCDPYKHEPCTLFGIAVHVTWL